MLKKSCLFLALMVSQAIAAADSPLSLSLESHVVTVEATDEGRVEHFSPALEVAPGDTLEWRLVALNTSDSPLADVALIMPLVVQVEFLPGSARLSIGADSTAVEKRQGEDPDRAQTTFSADGGRSFHVPPLTRTVVVVRDGEHAFVERPVDFAEYTHAQVVLPKLSPGEEVVFVVRTEVR